MSFKFFARLSSVAPRLTSEPSALRAHSSAGMLTVKHDRHNHRFTVSPGSGAEAPERAVLLYRFTGDKEVDLMSTFVPETFRGHGVAAVLSQAALDFVVKEDLKARVSCWYIRKYIEEHPEQLYEQHLLP